MTGDFADWEDALDAYEARLAHFADQVRSPGAEPGEIPEFEPPAALGELPEVLAPRALALADNTRRLESEYRVKMKSVLKEMQSNRRPQRSADRTGSSFVDCSA